MRWVLVAAVLVGCAEQDARTPAMQEVADDAQCRVAHAIPYGTPQYTQCRMWIISQRSQGDANRAATAAALLGAGAIMMQRAQPTYPTQTQCTRFGNTMNCLSY